MRYKPFFDTYHYIKQKMTHQSPTNIAYETIELH